jgi:hypothetical protein
MMQPETGASPWNRFTGPADEDVRQLIGEERLRLSPEEYAARYGHLWGCFSFDRFTYHDPTLGAWVRRLGELFHDPAELLTPEELAEVRRQEAEGF